DFRRRCRPHPVPKPTSRAQRPYALSLPLRARGLRGHDAGRDGCAGGAQGAGYAPLRRLLAALDRAEADRPGRTAAADGPAAALEPEEGVVMLLRHDVDTAHANAIEPGDEYGVWPAGPVQAFPRRGLDRDHRSPPGAGRLVGYRFFCRRPRPLGCRVVRKVGGRDVVEMRIPSTV